MTYETVLDSDETVVRRGRANLQVNIETVGGELTLTTKRLIFQPHWLNIQRGSVEIKVEDVKAIEECWTKFLGILPILPNSLAVGTTKGHTFRFVIADRSTWARKLKETFEKHQKGAGG